MAWPPPVGWVYRRFTDLIGPDSTLLLGGLAVLLSFVLGAAHALLPGHGKTLIAAYLAGRRGTTRDAVLVGASVTVTHTAAVLVVGLLLATFASLLGEDVIGWLGVVSGLLVAAIGAGLLRSALLARRGARVRTSARLTRVVTAAPVLTAILVVVGIGLATRGLAGSF